MEDALLNLTSVPGAKQHYLTLGDTCGNKTDRSWREAVDHEANVGVREAPPLYPLEVGEAWEVYSWGHEVAAVTLEVLQGYA